LGQGYDSSVAFWNFLAVGNYAGRLYKFAMQEVKATQDRVHAQLVQDTNANEQEVLALLSSAPSKASVAQQVVQKLTDFTNAKGEYIMNEWRSLLPRLITT
jgi:dipeptidase